jgi:glycosyltransferase involved in cell wall biosynthesis
MQDANSTSDIANVPSRETGATVIITGPPWPRSGTGRVMQSQIQFYRSRGYRTVFIADPIRWNFTRDNNVWDEFRDGLNALGADHTLLASIEPWKFTLAKYQATLQHGRHGTALDWIIAIGRSAQLSADSMKLLRGLRVVLFHVNHVFTLGFALRLRKQLGQLNSVPMILDTHDIQSHIVHEKKERNPWSSRPDSVERLLRSEIAHLSAPSALIHLSVDDFNFFSRELPSQAHFLALPTIDKEFAKSVRTAGPSTEPIDLLFVADWHPANLAAIQWFFENVWPLIANSNLKFVIVGRIGRGVEEQAPHLYEKFRSHFLGEVADLSPYYRAARCVIAPMVSGTGVSIKTVEAFAGGKAFVGTSKAYRGMPMKRLEEIGIRAYDEPKLFAEAIVSALQNRGIFELLSQRAYDCLFSTDASFAVRDESLAEAFRLKNTLPRVAAR